MAGDPPLGLLVIACAWFITGRMPFLSPSEQRQSTKGIYINMKY